jgi:hypothetical protein
VDLAGPYALSDERTIASVSATSIIFFLLLFSLCEVDISASNSHLLALSLMEILGCMRVEHHVVILIG